MADLLPGTAEVDRDAEAEPRVLGLDSEDADDVLAALSAGTARSILTAAHDEPATASELAARADTSLQNAQYHIEKLEDAALLEDRGTRYSEKGREMTVYGPTDHPLVLFTGDDDERAGLRSALRRFLGAAGLLAVASVAVQVALRGLPGSESSGGGGGSDGPTAFTTAEATDPATAASGLPPGLVFFAGGAVVLALAAGWWYLRD